MSQISNKIEAHDRSIDDVLNNKKYTVDYFQREYNWKGKKYIKQLVSGLASILLIKNQEEEWNMAAEPGD